MHPQEFHDMMATQGLCPDCRMECFMCSCDDQGKTFFTAQDKLTLCEDCADILMFNKEE